MTIHEYGKENAKVIVILHPATILYVAVRMSLTLFVSIISLLINAIAA